MPLLTLPQFPTVKVDRALAEDAVEVDPDALAPVGGRQRERESVVVDGRHAGQRRAVEHEVGRLQAGEQGRIAIVTDINALHLKEGEDALVVELYRDGGLQQAALQFVASSLR